MAAGGTRPGAHLPLSNIGCLAVGAEIADPKACASTELANWAQVADQL